MTDTDQNQYVNRWLDEINKNPDNAEAATNLGNFYYDSNDAAQAIVYYNIALSIKPDQPGVRTDLGTMYWRNGIVSHAEKSFREVVDKHPGFATAYLNLGLLLVKAKSQTQEGRALWQQIVDKFSDDPASKRAQELLLETYQ